LEKNKITHAWRNPLKDHRLEINMETIGIIAAMSQESNALLRLIEQGDCSDLGPYRCYRFGVSGRDCWLLTSGMGTARAANVTRALVDAANPTLLVSVGIAGAVQADLAVGDVVVSGNSCRLDKQGLPVQFQPLARLSEAAWQAAARALQPGGANLFQGTTITTHGAQFVQQQPGQLTHPILEMETAGIAGVAAEKKIPLLSLRSISDGPRAPIPFDLEKMMDDQDNIRTGEIIKAILGHPQRLPQLARMVRNSRKAADNAAIALVAALSQAGPVTTS
jgi:nucleoside phosphorylase